MSRFGGGGKRLEKKQTVIDKLRGFFEKYFGIGGSNFIANSDSDSMDEVDEKASYRHNPVKYNYSSGDDNLQMVAEQSNYGEKDKKQPT